MRSFEADLAGKQRGRNAVARSGVDSLLFLPGRVQMFFMQIDLPFSEPDGCTVNSRASGPCKIQPLPFADASFPPSWELTYRQELQSHPNIRLVGCPRNEGTTVREPCSDRVY